LRWVSACLAVLLLIAFSPAVRGDSADISTKGEVQNVAPEILSVTPSKNSINVTETTVITITVRDNNSWRDIEDVSISIMDAQGLVRVDSKVTDNTVVDAGTLEFTYTYDPDDALPTASLGAFDVDVEVTDDNSASDDLHIDGLFTVTSVPVSPPPPPAILTVDTTPIKASIYVDNSLWGTAPQTGALVAGTYTISFGDVLGYLTPASETVTLTSGATKTVTGVYTEIPPENIKNESPTYEVLSITPEENATIEVENTAITKLTISVKNSVENVHVTVQELAERPATIEIAAPGITYAYLNIVAEHIIDAYIDRVTITFKVEKSWIREHEIDETTITLKRYAAGEWTSLPTEKVDEDDTYVYFSAVSPGLSVFAMSGTALGVNEPPSANFTWLPDEPTTDNVVTFDASASFDPDGTIVTYEWDFDGDGVYDDATGLTTSRSFTSAGDYSVGLKVTDDDGATDTIIRFFTVMEAPVRFPAAPVVSIVTITVVVIFVAILWVYWRRKVRNRIF